MTTRWNTDKPHRCAAGCGQPLTRWQTDVHDQRWHPECVPVGTLPKRNVSQHDADQALDAVARVRALHQPYRSVYDEGDNQSCAHCNGLTGYAVPWPCDTIQALNGEQT